MQERQETYGRYCLPVHQDPPFTIHPAFWPAFVAWLFACAIQVTSRHGIIHIGLGVGMMLDLLFMIGAFGLTRLMVWMREMTGEKAGTTEYQATAPADIASPGRGETPACA